MTEIKLIRVKYMPKTLEEGLLYFSSKFGVAGHLCPCGCGNKIITPIDSTEWCLKIKKNKPTLYPSIGNWQLKCQSHYWIRGGKFEWSYKWSEDEIMNGRILEEKRRKLYFDEINSKRKKWYLFYKIYNYFFKS